MRPFIHLHNHSDYSLLDGASRIEDMVSLASKYEMPAVALTDHGNMFGAFSFYKTAKKYGIKPILGCEIYVAPGSRHDKAPVNGSISDTNNHLVLLAETTEGYKNLVKLVSKGFLEGFYYKPRIDKEILGEHAKGLIGLSACLKGEVPQAMLRDNPKKAMNAAGAYRDILGDNNFFLEIQDHDLGLSNEKKVNTSLFELARSEGIPTVATNDCHYISRDDAVAHDILLCIGTGKKTSDEQRMRYPGDQFYFKSSAEMAALFEGYQEAYDNTFAISERVEVDLDREGFQLPRFEVPEGETAETYFESVVWKGFEARWSVFESMDDELERSREVYESRLKREIKVIQKMEFPSYFLITWDFIRFARDKGIPVGPGRGSAAGSLVAYSLRITDIDPIEHDLLFERFLNPERVTMPDIDIDFCEARRNEVIDYVTKKYGRDNVAQIITFGTMKARAVIRDVGRALDMPYAEVDRIAKMIPPTLDATLAKALGEGSELKVAVESDPKVKSLVESAKRLEGVSRHASTHAAGVVIAPKPLTEYLPLHRGSRGEITTQFDMRDCEAIGLLKMDFLGLRTLTLIQNCIKMINCQKNIEINLETLALNDTKTYELFGTGNTDGVFQFESEGMRDILRRFKPEKLDDLTALNALYRPGPIRSGMIDDFIKRKSGKVAVRYEHPAVEEILESTLGVIVYQEQVMQLASKLAGFSLGEADMLRRAMGKKNATVMKAQREKFISGSVSNDVPSKKAATIFELMEHFAGYGFNRSHSAAYALLAYQTAYLKANFPVYFMAALLTSEQQNTDKVVQYLNACREMKIEVLPPDINESELSFTVIGDRIRFGLAAVKNVGESAIESILLARKRTGRLRSPADLCEYVDLRLVNKRVFESLIKAGAFDSFGAKRSQLVATIDRVLDYGQQVQKEKEIGQGNLFGDYGEGRRSPSLEKLPDIAEWDSSDVLAFEKATLGFYLSGHPLDNYKKEILQYSTCDTRTLSGMETAKEVLIAGIIVSVRSLRTRKGDAMAVFRLEDQYGDIEVVVFPDLYARSFGLLANEVSVMVTGKPEVGEDVGKVLARKIILLDEVHHSEAETMILRIPMDSMSENTIPYLLEILEKHRGDCSVIFELCRKDYVANFQPHKLIKVEPSPELATSLETICGEGAVRFSK